MLFLIFKEIPNWKLFYLCHTQKYLQSMSKIHFHEDFYLPIIKGNKIQTARIGEAVPDLGKGEAIFSDGRSIAIEIKTLTHKPFAEMKLEEVKKDGFNSKGELWSALRTFYPDLKELDVLMLIEFSCI